MTCFGIADRLLSHIVWKLRANIFEQNFLLRCLDKAATVTEVDVKTADFNNPWRICTVTQVEELKILVRMFPVWATTIVFSAVYAQMSTMFVEQGMVLDPSLGSFKIPPASLSTFDTLSVIVCVPMYDYIMVPIARRFLCNSVKPLPLPVNLLAIGTMM